MDIPPSQDRMWCDECASVMDWCPGGPGLDIGAGGRTLTQETITVDRYALEARVRADACRLPFADGTVPWVFAGHVIEHFTQPREALAEWLRVVRPGGAVCVVVPDRRFTHGQNTDQTPHVYEWEPRGFVEQVLDVSLGFFAPWWEVVGMALNGLGGRVVSAGTACPGWSFHVVIERRQCISS